MTAPIPSLPPPMQPSLQSSGAPVVLLVLMWLAWLGVLVVADFFAFLMFAFADSPRAGSAAKVMIGPVFLWFAITFFAGIALLVWRGGWWQVPMAFVLAISPPFVVFAGYNLLMGSGSGSSSGASSVASPAAPPAVRMQVPPGGFTPPPQVAQSRPSDIEADIEAIKAEIRSHHGR